MIKGFIDESGVHAGSPVVTVAGYFARPKGWQEFSREWNRVLKPSGIKVYHASDAQALKGEFKNWSEDDRNDLVRQLLPVIPRHAVGIAISVVLKDFEEAIKDREGLRPYLGNPYTACFQWLLHIAVEKMQEKPVQPHEALAIVHENNDYQGQAAKAYEYVAENHDPNGNLHSLKFGTKKQFIPLQTADILAYEVGKRVVDTTRQDRRSFKVLCGGPTKPIIRYYDQSNMPELIGHMERAAIMDALSSRD